MALTVGVSPGPLLGAGAALAIPVRPAKSGPPTVGDGAQALESLGIDARARLRAEKATGRAGEVTVVPVHRDGVDAVLLAGVGEETESALRKAAAAVVRKASGSKSLATTLATGRDPGAVRAIAEAVGLASYTFSGGSAKPAALKRVRLVVDDPNQVRAELGRAAAVRAAVGRARDLANTPSLTKTPQWLAEQAREFCADSGVAVTIRDELALAVEGFRGILAVGKGSAHPPRLVEMTWAPQGSAGHVVLVGKGISFDSGGLSLKPGDSMPGMKTDMAGGAAVIATMAALPALGIRVAVTGLVPIAENMPGASSMRPGDVITHYDGRTDEVLNTDAEGRIVLADALGYAVARLDPDVLIDIATLTGAATLGLGKRHGALYSTSDGLRDALVEAASNGGERLWPMPLEADYREAIESDVADLRNIPDPGYRYSGGSITAALFLREFVGSTAWAHLDVAGPARADGDEDEVTKGATGFGVRTFLRLLEAFSADPGWVAAFRR